MSADAAPILVVKLGALGDFVQATGSFAAIRRHHAGAPITLLTIPAYAELARAGGWFDAVWTEGRPAAADPGAWLRLRRRLRGAGFARVYDLQTSDRSSFYFRLFWPGPYPEWSGMARGCSHPHANPQRDLMHTIERQAEQLRMAGIAQVPPPDLSWAKADVARFGLETRFALLVPGGSPHRPAKRWPAPRYGELARLLGRRGVRPVLLGLGDEANMLDGIAAGCPSARSLAGETSVFDLVELARLAVGAVGNDTGPMHLIATAGGACVVLFSKDSDPALCAPRGPRVEILRRPDLGGVSAAEVMAALDRQAPLS